MMTRSAFWMRRTRLGHSLSEIMDSKPHPEATYLGDFPMRPLDIRNDVLWMVFHVGGNVYSGARRQTAGGIMRIRRIESDWLGRMVMMAVVTPDQEVLVSRSESDVASDTSERLSLSGGPIRPFRVKGDSSGVMVKLVLRNGAFFIHNTVPVRLV